MKRLLAQRLILLFLTAWPAPLSAQEGIRHEMEIALEPEKRRVEVSDTISLPEAILPAGGEKLHFLLHAGLRPVSPTKGVKVVRDKSRPQHRQFGMVPGSFEPDRSIPLDHYTVSLPPGQRRFVLQYQGEIHHPIEQEGEEYARSFSETPGIISSDGVFLAGSTYWYPWFNDGLVSFTLDVIVPKGWEAVSQGERTQHIHEGNLTRILWDSPEPQEEIYLLGGPWTEYSRSAGPVQVMAFLRIPDEALANQYLTTTAQYLEMYSKLIGPYPYKKFVLVENFWETGYGMPSFTLLGPKVIRFPFILHSSYPHEILHNWWGNGVYVDYPMGNWSEGLTTYLADHLIQEQRGTAVEYRRAALQKYTDYVTESKDFPLTEFRSRKGSVTEAVGYGKTLMFFHMLRQRLGDEAFTRALQKFYREKKFQHASFSDLIRAFESVSGQDLRIEMSQWVTRPGAPALRVSNVQTQPLGTEYLLTALIEQTQPGPAYRLRVPIAVTIDGREQAYQTTIRVDTKRLGFELLMPGPPLRLDMDPEFDLFRRLDRSEIPPALTQAFGADKVLMILPSKATEKVREGLRQMAESWKQSRSGLIEIKSDQQVAELPSDRAIWLLGWDNRFQSQMITALADYDVALTDTGVRIGTTELKRNQQSVVLTARPPANPHLALTWVATDQVAAMPGLGRKLPHYGSYSFLGFEGDEPTNIVKGQWPVVQSPMSVVVSQADGAAGKETRGTLSPRHALAYLPAVFSGERILQDIHWLAREELRGRGLGTPELDRVADFIAEEFKKTGLKPGGDGEGNYFQVWKDRIGDSPREVVLKNVVGILPGTQSEWAGQSVVIGAHYDHLGLGWPDVHEGDRGKIHPGADDNASGVAVLLELARALGSWHPDRTVVFVAFTGEEARLRGSKYYVEHQKRFPAGKVIGMLNLDTVGRLGKNKLTVLGTGSAREWIHIFMGAGAVTGISVEPVANDFGSSDQKSFLDAGVPAVQFFSGPNLDYHRPTDTVNKIDPAGLVKVAAVLKEAVEYLAGRPEPLTAMIGPKGQAPTAAVPEPGRKVSLGTVPDFAYDGKGIRISAISPGSPVAQAGLTVGDIIVRIDDRHIEDLRAYNDFLKAIQPGQTVSITFLRDGKEHTVQTKAVAR